MTQDSQANRDGEPEKILAGVDSRSEPFHGACLNWRPEGKNDRIPDMTYETRLSLLGDEDRAAVEREFGAGRRGREFKRLFFGGNVYGSSARNDAATMMGCAFAGSGEEGAMRIFWASASFDAVRMDDGAIVGFDGDGRPILRDMAAKYRPLAKKAVEIAGGCREKLDALHKEGGSRVIAKGSKAVMSDKAM